MKNLYGYFPTLHPPPSAPSQLSPHLWRTLHGGFPLHRDPLAHESMAQPPVETCSQEQGSEVEPAGTVLMVTCGQNQAELHIQKMRMTGKSVEKCVLYLNRNG